MQRKHVAFILESSYGHILPTVGIATELLRRGYRVSYAVSSQFSTGISRLGAEVIVYRPLDYRVEFVPKVRQYQGSDREAVTRSLWDEFEKEEFRTTLDQLTEIYRDDKPDLIFYDLRNLAGKMFAQMESIPSIEHSPMLIEHGGKKNIFGQPYDENLVLISLPSIFQHDANLLEHRFHFTGFCAAGRELFFNTWNPKRTDEDMILIAGTTAGLSQSKFFELTLCALEGIRGRIVLSLGQTDVKSLGALPPNVEVNPGCSNLSILKDCRLYIGQGGQGSTLEALYWGVPVILIPPMVCDETFMNRVVELGCGFLLESTRASADAIRNLIVLLLGNDSARKGAAAVGERLRLEDGARCAADLIEHVARSS
jgi:UDP:flavonoid glycosyltransferase YjiC (YdhE family)